MSEKLSPNCQLCSAPTQRLFTATILEDLPVDYFRCSGCQLVQTQQPTWLQHADERNVSAADTGILQRNLYIARVTSLLLRAMGLGRQTVVDIGGGYGILTRLMRDYGFDFRWHDLYSPNLLSRGFEHPSDQPIEVATAFEVLEHVYDSKAFFDEFFATRPVRALIATTTLYSWPLTPQWWYLALETGQHVSLYSRATMQWIAQRYGYHYAGAGYFHVFSKQPLSSVAVRICTLLGRLPVALGQRRSLTTADNESIRARIRSRSL